MTHHTPTPMEDVRRYWRTILLSAIIAALLIFAAFNFLSEDATARKTCWNYGYDHGYYNDDDGIVCREHIDTPLGELINSDEEW